MAVISSPPLSNPLIVDAVDVDTVLTATATEYEWTSSDGVHIRLVGSFVYTAGTTLDVGVSTVTDVIVDVDFNGAVDLLVDFGLPNSVVPALTSGSTFNFRNALFEGEDSGVLDGTFGPAALAAMPLDALLPAGMGYFGDTFQLRGSGYVLGDTDSGGSGNIGGADVLTVDRTNDTSISIVYGDFALAAGSFFGGDDRIEDIGTTSTGTTTFIGDLFRLSLVFPATLTGGDDTLIGENANALLIGDIELILEPGHTILGGADSIEGGSGNDTLTGDVDTLFSGADNNIITGGNDTLQGRDGNDYIAGDVRVVGVVPSGNTITGGDDLLSGGAGADSLFGDFPSEQIYTIGNTLIGGNDTLAGGDGNDLLVGGSGNDSLDGDGDHDTLEGGDGQDTLDGGAGDDVFVGGLGDDHITGGSGVDELDFSSSSGAISLALNNLGNGIASGQGTDSVYGMENLTGSDFADTLGGGGQDNLITGGEGDDSLSGGGGQDTLSYAQSSEDLHVDLSNQGVSQDMGSLGNDFFVNFEVVWTGTGNDTVTAHNFTAIGGGPLDFDGGAGVDRFVLANNGAVNTVVLGVDVQNFENISGSGESDVIGGDAGANNVQGRGGDDTVQGNGGGDTVSGGNGNDEVSLGTGGGTARGDGGNDTVTGSSDLASDLSGGTGVDTMTGGLGDDTIRGQGDGDEINGGGGGDLIYGGSGNDTVLGGAGADNILGQGNNDILDGGEGNDTIIGAAGSDTVLGGAGDDSMTGGAGADALAGDGGNDTMNGGSQADEFIFDVGFDTDRINGFEQGVDQLLLDQDLWLATEGVLTEQEVIDTFGTLNAGGTILTLDFGGGDVLEVQSGAGITQATLGLDVTIFDYSGF